MKHAIKHIIFLCLMLILGNGVYFSPTLAASLFATSKTNTAVSENTIKQQLNQLLSEQATISNPVKEHYKKKDYNVDTEEEDSEISTSKKSLEKPSYSLSVFRQQVPHFKTHHSKNSFGFRKEIFYFPVYKTLYIIFQVFRI